MSNTPNSKLWHARQSVGDFSEDESRRDSHLSVASTVSSLMVPTAVVGGGIGVVGGALGYSVGGQQQSGNPRRGSIFDLLFLLRKSSTSRKNKDKKTTKEEMAKTNEGDSFLNEATEKDEEERPMNKQQLLAKIREKKEVIEKLRCQPWPMRRKRRTLKLAQKYLQRYEPEVSRTHAFMEALRTKWKHIKWQLLDFSAYLIPWESKIKGIESRFGSVVSSYFIFLRWILALNFVISMILLTFIVIPEVLADKLTERMSDPDKAELYRHRKTLSEAKANRSDQLQVIWDFQGKLARSPLFLGYYSNETWLTDEFKYRLPLTYFLVNIFLFGFSFFIVLRKMATNARLNKMYSDKTEQYPFAWKCFTGWDYMIGVTETASNAIMANVMKFKESMTGHKEKQKEKFHTFLINHVVERSVKVESETYNANSFEKNEVPIAVSIITLVYPNLFELLSNFLERFHPRIGLRLQLGRILALYLLNFYTLIFALNNKMKKYRAKQEAYNTNSSLKALRGEVISPAALYGSANFGDLNYSRINLDEDNSLDHAIEFLSENDFQVYNELLINTAELFNRTLSLLPRTAFFTYHSVPLLSVINILYSNVNNLKLDDQKRVSIYETDNTDSVASTDDYRFEGYDDDDEYDYRNVEETTDNDIFDLDREIGIQDIDKMSSAEMDDFLQKLRRGRFERLNYDSVKKQENQPESISTLLSVTTINPIFGKIGVNNTSARVKHNVTREELRNLLLLEIRAKNGAFRRSNGRRGGTTTTPTFGADGKPAVVERPVIIPFVGHVLEKISSAYRTLKDKHKKKPKTESKGRTDGSVETKNKTATLEEVESEVLVPNIPGVMNVIPQKPKVDRK
uniref:Uncharacterized protein n=1 Tax=Romanomermis culicivorax TaxID=13658 RepID=A0A915KM17_ROMCU